MVSVAEGADEGDWGDEGVIFPNPQSPLNVDIDTNRMANCKVRFILENRQRSEWRGICCGAKN